MADFLTTGERAQWNTDADMIFDTMSQGRTVTIVREPTKIQVVASSTENVFGFGNEQKDAVYEYTPVSGTFPAIIRYPSNHESPLNPEMSARIYAGEVTIKVRSDCRDYIKGGKIQFIVADDKTFYIDGEERRQMFLNQTYYLYDLKASK